MKDVWSALPCYLKGRWKSMAAFGLFMGIFAAVYALYRLPAEPAAYGSLIVILLAMIFGGVNFKNWYLRRRCLARLKDSAALNAEGLPQAAGLIEADYQALVRQLQEELREARSQVRIAQEERSDYYTMWAHQIKIPISALSLLLHSARSSGQPDLTAMERERFKIEKYADMALCYLRLESFSSDLTLEPCPLEPLVRAAVKKYALFFIGHKIELCLGDLDAAPVTDQKWLAFVVEQLLSNALKYTPGGGRISIGLERGLPLTLTVADTGIGILPEDLPRIFERGYTGRNGRADKKSTGIGLYLSRRILDKLGHSISARSQVGQGSCFYIDLYREKMTDL